MAPLDTESFSDITDPESSLFDAQMHEQMTMSAAQAYREQVRFREYADARVPLVDARPVCVVHPDGTLEWNLHSGQARVMQSRKRYIVACAGRQSGKSEVGVPWLYEEMQACGPGWYMVVAPSYPLLEDSALPKFRVFFENHLQLGRVHVKNMQFVLSKDGERRLFGHAQQNPTVVRFCHAQNAASLEAKTALACWFDEAGQDGIAPEAFEAIEGRMTTTLGRLLLTTTPYNLGYLKTRWVDPWEEAGRDHPDIDIINWKSIENPRFSRAEYERLRKTMPAWRHAMFYDGVFSVPAGLIYGIINEVEGDVKIEPFELPAKWPRFVGLDFGGINTCGIKAAQDPHNGDLFLYRCYLPGEARRIADHVQAILAGEYYIDRCCGGSRSEGQWREEFIENGLIVDEPEISDIHVGIARVYGLLANRRIKIFDESEHSMQPLWRDLYSYRYETDPNTGETLPEMKIVDQHKYHTCLVADTQIECLGGQKPIQNVSVGDMVLTRNGYRRVAASCSTGIRPVKRVELSDGSSIIGTGDHPVWVVGKGWISIDDLRSCDILSPIPLGVSEKCQNQSIRPLSLPKSAPARGLSSLITAGYGILDTLTLAALMRNTLAPVGGVCCTGMCGLGKTGRYLTASISTTRTKILPTTESKTWSALAHKSTGTDAIAASAAPSSGSTWPGCGNLHSHGTRQRRVAECTLSAIKALGSLKLAKCATAAVNRILLKSLTLNSARTGADSLIEERAGSISPIGRARDAGRSTGFLSMPGRATAHVSVLAVREEGLAEVFNLSVDDCHEYYANGVLVSNCDALRYLGSMFGNLLGDFLAHGGGERPDLKDYQQLNEKLSGTSFNGAPIPRPRPRSSRLWEAQQEGRIVRSRRGGSARQVPVGVRQAELKRILGMN